MSKTLQELQIEHSEIATYRAKCLANAQHWSEQLRGAEQKEAELISQIQALKQEQAETKATSENSPG